MEKWKNIVRALLRYISNQGVQGKILKGMPMIRKIIPTVFLAGLVYNSESNSMQQYSNKQPFGMSTIGKEFSDHEAFSTEIPLGGGSGSTKIKVLSWNTWARGTRGGFDDNTVGYGNRKEPNADKRIKNNFVNILDFFNNNKNSIVCLEEIADVDIKHLSTIGNNISFYCSKSKGESFNTCTLYKASEFTIKGKASSDDIPSINNLKTQNKPITEQKDRYIHLQLINKESFENLNIINVHLKWHSTPDDIINALNSYLTNCKGTCIITGDFNQNLNSANVKLDNASQFVYENGSISSDNKQRKQNTTDALIYKLGSNTQIDIDDVLPFIKGSLQKDVKNAWKKKTLSFDNLIKLANTDFTQQESVWKTF